MPVPMGMGTPMMMHSDTPTMESSREWTGRGGVGGVRGVRGGEGGVGGGERNESLLGTNKRKNTARLK